MLKKKTVRSKGKSNEVYKQLTSLLFMNADDPTTEKAIDSFVIQHTTRELNNHIYRLINQLGNYPNVIRFIDKYMNNLDCKWDFKQVVFTLQRITYLCRITNTNQLKFSRFKQIERDNLFKVFKAYFAATNQVVTPSDLTSLYTLFEVDKIGQHHIEYMKVMSSDKTVKSKKENVKIDVVTPKKKDDEADIVKFKTGILQYLKTRTACGSCPLKQDGFLLITTNLSTPGPVDVLFVSDGASVDETLSQIHGFEAGDTLRQVCESRGLTYAFINLTMCKISNAKTTAQVKKSFTACESVVAELKGILKPTIEVVVGNHARTYYGIKGGTCNKLNGNVYENKIVTLDYDKLVDKHLIKFLSAFDIMLNTTTFKKREQEVKSNIGEVENNRSVSAITPDLTLFDIKEIGNQVLYIFTNNENEKVYFTEESKIPVYIKYGSMKECEYITPIEGADRCVVTPKQISQIKRLLYRG